MLICLSCKKVLKLSLTKLRKTNADFIKKKCLFAKNYWSNLIKVAYFEKATTISFKINKLIINSYKVKKSIFFDSYVSINWFFCFYLSEFLSTSMQT